MYTISGCFPLYHMMQEQLNSLKVVGAQLANKTFLLWKLNPYEYFKFGGGTCP